MDGPPERRRYYPEEENVPLSTTVREAIAAHPQVDRDADEMALYDNIDPEGIDRLFRDTADADVSIRIDLDRVTVGIWGDGGVDIQVTEKYE